MLKKYLLTFQTFDLAVDDGDCSGLGGGAGQAGLEAEAAQHQQPRHGPSLSLALALADDHIRFIVKLCTQKVSHRGTELP